MASCRKIGKSGLDNQKAGEFRPIIMSMDPNRTIMGTAPSLNATQTIKPVQCPVCKTFNPVGVMFCVDCGLIFDRALDGDAFGAPTVLLPVLVDEAGREFRLQPGENVVGRSGDVALDDGRVSRRHAMVLLTDGSVTVTDLGSTNGTKARGEAVSGSPVAVADGDELSFGGKVMRLSLPGEAGKTSVGVSGRTAALDAAPSLVVPVGFLVDDLARLPFFKGENTIGRKKDNAICVPDAFVSGFHALLRVEESWVLEDLGSTNGTFVNGEKIEAPTVVDASSALKFGDRTFRIDLAE